MVLHSSLLVLKLLLVLNFAPCICGGPYMYTFAPCAYSWCMYANKITPNNIICLVAIVCRPTLYISTYMHIQYLSGGTCTLTLHSQKSKGLAAPYFFASTLLNICSQARRLLPVLLCNLARVFVADLWKAALAFRLFGGDGSLSNFVPLLQSL